MDYVIKNNKSVYIRINELGQPVTCVSSKKTLFEHSKAMNVLDNLPKTLKKMGFKVEAVLEIPEKSLEKTVLQKENYVVPDTILQWVKKFEVCEDILKEAQKRKEELHEALSDIDKEFVNIIHQIEFEGKIDLYGGWKERNKIKKNREKRREIKDELLIISNVLRMDFTYLDRKNINKSISGLEKRKFAFRTVKEETIIDAM